MLQVGTNQLYPPSYPPPTRARDISQPMDGTAGTAFVLVAGGLGERLGYSGIKVALPTETTTDLGYLNFYLNYFKRYSKEFLYKYFEHSL